MSGKIDRLGIGNTRTVRDLIRTAVALLLITLLAGCASEPVMAPVENPPVAEPLKPVVIRERPIIAFALGGGAARGFAHAGVLRVLKAHGVRSDIVVGMSAGSVAGAMIISNPIIFSPLTKNRTSY